MTIHQALRTYKNVEIDLLLVHVLKQPKEFLYLNPKATLTKQQTAALAALVARRKKGEPVAYIVGYKYFYGLKFKINKNVLTPRPETEWLVEHALNRIKNKKPHLAVLDVGTGSGCVAISLAHSLVTYHLSLVTTITASDVSSTALKVAEQKR